MERFITTLATVYKWICAFIIAVMVMIVFTNTLLRYGFNSGIVETEELVRYLFVVASFMGILTVYVEHRHIAVTTVTDRLSPHMARVFTFVTSFLVLYALYVFMDGAYMYMGESATNIGQVTNIPYVWIIGVGMFSIGGCMLVVVLDMVTLGRQIFGAQRTE